MSKKDTNKQVLALQTATRTHEAIEERPIPLLIQPRPELQEQIRELAYSLYEQRGRADGYAEQDWLQAEAILLGRKEKLAA